MNEAVKAMLKRYALKSLDEEEQALKEIIQEIALLGLWRAKFFERAAFYGGTALRIFHSLDRFSEDLDFSLLRPDSDFNIGTYEEAIKVELQSFGFDVSVERKAKAIDTEIESAFIKANTLIHLLKIGSRSKTHKDKALKIKLEVDTDPPGAFTTEDLAHFQPAAHSVKVMSRPSLFAGKMHALLCRNRVKNTKGRDWYDLLWYVGSRVAVNVAHLESRMRQSGHWTAEAPLDETTLRELAQQKLAAIDLDLVKADVLPFARDPQLVRGWTKSLFEAAITKMLVIPHE